MKGTVAGLVLLGISIGGPLLAAGSEIEKGKKIYEEKRCGLCHAIAGQGSKIGPDLSNVGTRRDREWLTKFLKDPKGTMPGAKMLPVKATEEELSALVAYMLSLKR